MQILHGDALEQLKTLPDESVQCCVTSPPYWGLRDYGTAEWEGGDPECSHIRESKGSARPAGRAATHGGDAIQREFCRLCGATRIDSQLGLEATPEEYVEKMVRVFREVRRVLRDDGTLWLNLGDSYAGSNSDSSAAVNPSSISFNGKVPGLKPKDLVGIPWCVAFALQADGWWLRQDIIWAKPNPMPESVTDRCTKSHEYVFLLTKSARYYYDAEAVKERSSDTSLERLAQDVQRQAGSDRIPGKTNGNMKAVGTEMRNARSVWMITTKPYKGAHFAVFPPEIPEKCIRAGTSEKGCCVDCGKPVERVVSRESECNVPRGSVPSSYRVLGQPQQAGVTSRTETVGWQLPCGCKANTKPCVVLDPFAGSGTTLEVAKRMGRDFIGIELNEEYIDDHIKPRVNDVNPLFSQIL